MKRVKVLKAFHSKELKRDLMPNEVIEVSEKNLEEIREINVNMVLVLGDVEEVEKEEELLEDELEVEDIEELIEDELEVEDIEELIEDELEVKDVEEPKVKKTRAKKTATKE